jgi:hypothetical protein
MLFIRLLTGLLSLTWKLLILFYCEITTEFFIFAVDFNFCRHLHLACPLTSLPNCCLHLDKVSPNAAFLYGRPQFLSCIMHRVAICICIKMFN